MSIDAIQHVNLRVPLAQLQQLRDFYCDVLGFVEGARPPFESVGFWLYARGEPIVHLAALREDGHPPASASLPQQAGRAAFDHVAFRCTDLGATLARLRERGVQHAVRHVALVEQTQVFLRDPCGTGLELNFDDPPAPCK